MFPEKKKNFLSISTYKKINLPDIKVKNYFRVTKGNLDRKPTVNH